MAFPAEFSFVVLSVEETNLFRRYSIVLANHQGDAIENRTNGGTSLLSKKTFCLFGTCTPTLLIDCSTWFEVGDDLGFKFFQVIVKFLDGRQKSNFSGTRPQNFTFYSIYSMESNQSSIISHLRDKRPTH